MAGRSSAPQSENSSALRPCIILEFQLQEVNSSMLRSHVVGGCLSPWCSAGSCITSDDTVTRDILYSGNPIQERCTVITRIAPTFIRFGSFEIFKTRDRETGRVGPSVGREDILHQLLDFVTQSYYPQVHIREPEDRRARTALFFRDLCVKTAHLVSAWQCVGFCHGLVQTPFLPSTNAI
jgi:uncharacterized protein YdiU (UPF0061 family)